MSQSYKEKLIDPIWDCLAEIIVLTHVVYNRWINSQRKSAAGWGSTVDTTVATEALVAWSARFNRFPTAADSPTKNDIPNFDTGNLVLEVDSQADDVTSGEGGNGRRTIVVISSGVESSRVMPLGNVTRSVKVEARGSGVALIHLLTRHVTTNLRHLVAENEDESSNSKRRNNVAIHLEPRLEFSGRDSSEIRVLSCQR